MAHGTPLLDYKWTTLCAMRNRWVACALIFWKFLQGHFPWFASSKPTSER